MANQVDRNSMTRWLFAHGFTEKTRKPGGHRRYVHSSSGVVISLMGHGPQDLTKKHVGMILRELERAGFSKDQARRELTGRK